MGLLVYDPPSPGAVDLKGVACLVFSRLLLLVFYVWDLPSSITTSVFPKGPFSARGEATIYSGALSLNLAWFWAPDVYFQLVRIDHGRWCLQIIWMEICMAEADLCFSSLGRAADKGVPTRLHAIAWLLLVVNYTAGTGVLSHSTCIAWLWWR